MTCIETSAKRTAGASAGAEAAMRLEVVVLPVADPDRSKQFYASLGWRPDLDYRGEDGYRVIQFTPPKSGCFIIFGRSVTNAPPGSVQGLHLIVSDIDVARSDLLRRGVKVSEPFHDDGGVFHHADRPLSAGPNPDRKSYASYAASTDPDGNGWVLQEITARLSGDVVEGDPRFTREVVNALRHPSAD